MRKDIKETNGLYQIDEDCRFWSVRTGKEVCKTGNRAQFSIKGLPKICRTKQSIYREYFLEDKAKPLRTEKEKVLNSRYNLIKRRCYVESDKQYKDYGGRGIKIFEDWLQDKKLFIKYCIENGFSSELSIDRIDNNGNYEPGNIRFVDAFIQNNNTRSNILIKDGENILTISRFCAKYDLNSKIVYQRLETIYNKDTNKLYEAFLKGDLYKRFYKVSAIVHGESLSLKEISDKFNISIEVVRSRWKRGKRGEDLIKEPIKRKKL